MTTFNSKELINESLKRALGGGTAGTIAMGTQVISLMWLRTTVNYQYKNGTTFKDTLKILYNEGGIRRFYRGVGPALLQAPLSRFGDTAMNTGVMYFLNNDEKTKNLPLHFKTFIGSCGAALWRINLMPIDTYKTMLQVNGPKGVEILKNNIKTHGLKVLYNGSLGVYGATLMGHFPWFFTYNYLNEKIPKPNKEEMLNKYIRYAGIGFSSSLVSDTVSNSARVLKTSKQTSKENHSYLKIIENIIEKDGTKGLIGRGLKTKILSNGLQGLLFTIVWKTLEEQFNL